jgi:hypothetical protein
LKIDDHRRLRKRFANIDETSSPEMKRYAESPGC